MLWIEACVCVKLMPGCVRQSDQENVNRSVCVYVCVCGAGVGKGHWEINDMKRLYIPGKCSDP